MRKTLASAILAGMLISGATALAVAAPASAHTPSVSATCEALNVNLTNYAPTVPGVDAIPGTDPIPGVHHDAVGSPTIEAPNPDYVPAIDAVATTYVQEFEYAQKNHPDQLQWHIDGWNPGGGWNATGNQRDSDEVLVQGHDAIPAVGSPTIEVPNPAYVPAYDDPETPGTPGTPAVPAETNHVTVTIDGSPVADTDFGTTYTEAFAFSDKTVAHDYRVQVESHDGIGNLDKTGTSVPCAPPAPGAANPAASIDTSCGLADVLLTNDGENILTASFVIYVDGDFDGAYAIAAGDHQHVELAFPEDSGDHVVTVRSGPAQGDEELASATVGSDCIAVVVPPTDNPSTPATPATPASPAGPAQSVQAAAPAQVIESVSDDTLAQTGSGSGWVTVLWIGGGLLAGGLAAAAWSIYRARSPRYYRKNQA